MKKLWVMVWIVGLLGCGSDDPEESDMGENLPDVMVLNDASDLENDASVNDMLTSDMGLADADVPVFDMSMGPHPGLSDPEQANERAPATYTVRMETTQGEILIDVTRAWSPGGADRFYNLVRVGFFREIGFFRNVPDFIVQAGIHGDPAISAVWRGAQINDDRSGESNTMGRVTFATAGPNTRTTQIFFNFGNNDFLDSQGFTPFGQVRDMAPLFALTAEYGEAPVQGLIQRDGNAYLQANFPNLDYIVRARIE